MAKVTINQDRCKGCGLCVSVCPRKVLALDTAKLFTESMLKEIAETDPATLEQFGAGVIMGNETNIIFNNRQRNSKSIVNKRDSNYGYPIIYRLPETAEAQVEYIDICKGQYLPYWYF